MKIASSVFEHNGTIPTKYTCDGENINPPLNISDVPEKARSLVIIMDDPDVPKHVREDGMWDHWIVFNLPTDLNDVNEGQEPDGVHGLGTGGNLSYYGPCPPDREHRYFFKLYALDAELNLPEKSTKKQVEDAMNGHVIEKAELIGKYDRKR